MACYHIFDKEVGKVLIPCCMNVAHSFDIEDCTCESRSHRNFEKQEYQTTIKAYKKEIAALKKG